MQIAESLSPYWKQIKNIRRFVWLNDNELKIMLKGAKVITYQPGENILSQGDESPHFYAILEGSIDISVKNMDEEVYISTIPGGDIFGEAAIFSTEKRIANVIAGDTTKVVRIHRANILSFIKNNPRSGIKFLMLIINSLLKKLRTSNMEMLLEKQTDDVGLEEIDPLIREIIGDI